MTARTIARICAERPASVPLWKRCFDIVFASVGLAIAMPLMLLLAALVKLSSPGPVFYSQERYGLNGKLFRILKFRKMPDSVRGGERVTARHDFRMTRLGRVLERTKLDELPQLINILKGEMSVVGPRPEDPAFAELHPEDFATILSTPPGVAGPNQIRFRNESELYPADCTDRGAYYADHILRQKIPVDVEYVRSRNLLRDVMILLGTLGVTVSGVLPLATVRRRPQLLAHVAAFPMIAAVSLAAAFALYDPWVPFWRQSGFGRLLLPVAAVYTLSCFFFAVPSIIVRHLGLRDLGALVKAAASTTAVALLATFLPGAAPPRAAVVPLACFLVVAGYFWLNLLHQYAKRRRAGADTTRRLGVAITLGLVGVATYVVAGWIVAGPGGPVQVLSLTGGVAVLATNAAVFFVLGGDELLLRPDGLRDQLALVGAAALASITVHAGRYLAAGEPAAGDAFLMVELLSKATLAIGLQWAFADGARLLPRNAGRTLLVGTLAEVNTHMQSHASSGTGRVAGVVLVNEHRQGMTIHALPILGELAEVRSIRDQLQFERVVALSHEHSRALAELGVESDSASLFEVMEQPLH